MFANNRLVKDRELEEAARLRLAAAYTDLVTSCQSAYAEGFDRIEADLANVFDTIDWCHAREQWQYVVDFSDGLAEFLWVRGYWAERIKRATQGLDAARRLGDSMAMGRCAYSIGWVESRWNHQVEARRWADEAEAAMQDTYGEDNPFALELRGLAAFREQTVAPTSETDTTAFEEAETLLHRAAASCSMPTSTCPTASTS